MFSEILSGKSRFIIILIILLFHLQLHSQEVEHNCSMWAGISTDFPDSLIYNHLRQFPNSLKNLSRTTNLDGWGIVYYSDSGDGIFTQRGAIRAYNDAYYDLMVENLEIVNPPIILAHIRNCSSGCCCPGCEIIPDPHPFIRYKNGKYWSFMHNGSADKSLLYMLIGEEYLISNAPTGSGIAECDPSDTSLIVDSELLFIYLLKCIEENDWDIEKGISTIFTRLVSNDMRRSYNFVLSDGNEIWALCFGYSLYYLYDSVNGFSAIATKYPSEEQEEWIKLNDREFIKLTSQESPVLYVPQYVPGDFSGDGYVTPGDVIFGIQYFRGVETPDNSCYNETTDSWFYCGADVNGDCKVIGSDVTYLVNYFRFLNELSYCHEYPINWIIQE